MIAYLEKYDTTAEVPDDMGDKDVKDINDNFHSYVDTKPAAEARTPASATPTSPGEPPPTDLEKAQDKLPEPETPKWQPNFYEASLSKLMAPVKAIGEAIESPEAQAFAGKTLEGISLGTNKEFFENYFAQQYKDHPVPALLGTVTGGIGSLLASAGAASALGAGEVATAAGKAAEPLWAAGQRFIPRGIMGAATFGTHAFISETVKAFEDGHVNLEQFGKDVLSETAFGTGVGLTGGIPSMAGRVASAAGLGFVSAKMMGADNREAGLHSAIWAFAEGIFGMGQNEALRLEALGNFKETLADYVQGRNPDIPEGQARGVASAFVDNAMKKAGYPTAEAIAKSGPENLLEGIEKVNQMVRTAQVPHPGEPGEPLPKLPAPAGAAAPAGVPATPEEPKSVLDTAIDKVKGMLGIEKPPEVPAPAPAGPQPIEKSMADIGERLTVHGLKETEKEAIFNHYTQNLPEMIRQPLPDQYRQVYDLLAKQRGITGDKFDSNTIDQAEKAVDLINDHFGTKSQELLQFAQAHPEASVNEVAQMAHDRGMMESPNPDLLNAELRKATKEQIPIQPEQGHQPMEDVLYQADLDKFNTWRDIIGQGIQPPKTGEMDEYKSLPLWMKNSAGRPYDEIAQVAAERGLIKPGEDIFSTLRELKKPLKSESGAVMIPPDLADVAEHIRASSDEISHLVNPAKAAPLAYRIHRANIGKMAQAYDRAEAALKESIDFMDKQPTEFTNTFKDKWEAGESQGDTNLDAMMNQGKKILDDKWKQYEEVIGKTKPQLANYFPHDWEQGEKQVSKAIENASRRPWAGKQAFRKERTIPDIKTGRSIGLTEKEQNPMRAVLNKVREMDKFITAHQTLKELKAEGLAKFFRVGDKPFDGWKQIDDRISTVVFKGEQGPTISGHIYAQPDAARIINNYLSPGLSGSKIFQDYRFVANSMVRARLGLSLFHSGFMTLNSFNNTAALALNQLMTGHPINAAGELGNFPVAPIRELIMGNKLRKAWFGKSGSDFYEQIATLAAESGARARMDPFWAMESTKQMKQFFKTGRVVQGVISLPFSVLEQISKPLMEHMVPLQKFGAWAQIMKMEMDNNPKLTHTQLVEIGQRGWDSVDNRMGQFVTDNLAWNKTFKNLTMSSLQSMSWHLGEFREAGGAVKEAGLFLKDILSGKRPKAYYKLAYTMIYPIVVGLFGAMLMKLRTGKNPETIKDLYYPQTGGLDENGNPHRVALPSYMKDYFHLIDNPIQAATNWLNPLPQTIAQELENRDYNGVKIRNEDDPLVRQVMSEIAHALKQWEPYSISNMLKNHQTGNKTLFDTLTPWVGITPAGYDINATKAEKTAHEIMMSHQEIGGRTEEQAQRSRLLSELTRNYKMGDPKAVDHLEEAYQKGLISHRQMQNVIVNSEMTPLQRMVKGMTLQEAERVYSKANDEEKAQIGRMVERKQENRAKEYVTP